jgi:serine protease Do
MTARVRVLATLVLLSMLPLGCARATSADRTKLWQEAPVAVAAPELTRFNDLLADLAERLKPALVHVRVRRGGSVAKDDDAPGEPRRSTGSGFVIDPNGLIVTNAHVVEQAEWIQVRLADGRRFNGRTVGLDSRVDLALVRIDATGLPVLPLGDSNRMRVGEFVLALGHPFGLEQSVSFGIVSRKGAPLTVAAPGFDFIQTDAAINPGNSGGPLVNMAGQVIGVNSMAARNGSIGFAIPSNLVKLLVPQLASKGKIEWGWLGVSIAEVTDEDVPRLKLRDARGVLVRGVMPGEPAAVGGVKADDVLVAVDGTPLEGPRDLQRVVSSTPVGKRVRLVLLREGRETEVEVTIGLYKEREARERDEAPKDKDAPADGPKESPKTK